MNQNIALSLLDNNIKPVPIYRKEPEHLHTASTVLANRLPYFEFSESKYRSVTSKLRYFSFTDMFSVAKSINAHSGPIKHQDLPVPYETYNFEKKICELDRLWNPKETSFKPSQLRERRFINCLAKCYRRQIIVNLILFMIQITSNIVSCVLLGEIIAAIAIADTDTDVNPHLNQGTNSNRIIYYFVGFVSLNLCTVISENISNYEAYKLGSSVHFAVMSLIYKKLHTIALSSVQDISVGKMINLFTNGLKALDGLGEYICCLLLMPYGVLLIFMATWIYFGSLSILSLIVQTTILAFAGYLSNLSVELRNQKNDVTEQRIKYTNEFVENIQLLKLYSWEEAFLNEINRLRDLEVKICKKLGNLSTISIVLGESCTYICTLITSIAYVLNGGILSAEKVYILALILNFAEFWIIEVFLTSITTLVTAKIACKTIEEVLDSNEIAHTEKSSTLESPNNIFGRQDATKALTDIVFTNYSASWSANTEKYCLKNINLTIQKQSHVAVIGKVGSGKTTLLMSLLKEIPLTTGQLSFSGSLAYVEQEPVLFSGSVRDNILFGKDFDEPFYINVLRACNIDEDLRQFDFGDQTMIGERGVTLSGGQKARLSLARALYARSDIYLLDDPLSAVDSRVGEIIFEVAIQRLLKGKTVILVTHHLNYTKKADKVIVMKDGSIEAVDTFDNLLSRNIDLLQAFKIEEKHYAQESTNVAAKSKDSQILSIQSLGHGREDEYVNYNVQETLDENSSVTSTSTYIKYLQKSNSYLFGLIILVLYLAGQVAVIYFTQYIGYWAQAHKEANSKLSEDEYGIDTIYHIKLCVGLLVIIMLCSYIKLRFTIKFVLDINTNLHKEMLQNISRALMSFFNSTAIGVVLNRFSNDIDVLDTANIAVIYDLISQAISTSLFLASVCYINPLIILPSLLVITGLYTIKIFFGKSTIEFQRLFLKAQSPLYSELSAALNSLLTIRIYNQGSRFTRGFLDLSYTTIKTFSMYLRTIRLFTISLQLLLYVLISTGVLSFIFMAYQSKVEVRLLGLAIYYLMNIANQSTWIIRQSIAIDINMQSAQRMEDYCHLPEEAPAKVPLADHKAANSVHDTPSAIWPAQGCLCFQNVFLRYPNSINYALNGLTFTVEPECKIGIVGRTGAGKSSIIQALFRIVETENRMGSSITIDGVDIKSLGLELLRKGLSILPQAPVIFTGTIRRNLDPFNELSNSSLWEALDQVGLKTHISSLVKGIDTDISMSSSVFSAGQKQLMCLARLIVRKSKVVVIDEGTANVDTTTDNFIQDKINEVFKECVVLTIAHRLSTVAHYDKILVMDKGMMVEYDHPYKLLVEKVGDREITRIRGGFVSMVRRSGERVAQEIFNKAYTSYYSKIR